MISRKLIALTAVTGLSLSLAACGDSTDTDTATTMGATTATSAETAPGDTTDTQETTVTGEDPVFQAIDAVTAAHPDGIITDIDREDSTDVYDIDVVVGQDVLELVVNAGTGEVREEERDNDDDSVREANDAQMNIRAAIEQALEQHPDGVLDEISLNEEDGRLEWDIDLDDANRNDLTELVVQDS